MKYFSNNIACSGGKVLFNVVKTKESRLPIRTSLRESPQIRVRNRLSTQFKRTRF